jgi:hypothetical protein
MSDVFISYARDESRKAEQLGYALEAQGISVWWDRRIPAGESWANLIEQQLDKSRCVVVLVSRTSIASEWVLDEAAYAQDSGKLLPVLLEDVEMPLRMQPIQAADLRGWKGEADHPKLKRLLAEISKVVTSNDLQDRKKGPLKAKRDRPLRVRRRLTYVTAAICSACLLGFVVVRHLTKPNVSVEVAGRTSTSVEVVLRWTASTSSERATVFLYSISNHLYYPSNCGAAAKSGVNFCRIEIGPLAKPGAAFELVPVLLTPNAEAAIERYKEDPTAAGLAELPDGVSVFDRTTIITR